MGSPNRGDRCVMWAPACQCPAVGTVLNMCALIFLAGGRTGVAGERGGAMAAPGQVAFVCYFWESERSKGHTGGCQQRVLTPSLPHPLHPPSSFQALYKFSTHSGRVPLEMEGRSEEENKVLSDLMAHLCIMPQ